MATCADEIVNILVVGVVQATDRMATVRNIIFCKNVRVSQLLQLI